MSSDNRTKVDATDVLPRVSPAEAKTIARLVVCEGANKGAGVALVRAHATVGRHPTNDLVLHDSRVSSVHLELGRRPGGHVLVRDAGSTNGTWLGEHQVIEVELAPGAVVRVGDTLLRVEVDDRAPQPQPSPASQFQTLVGGSPEMQELFVLLERVASKPLSLLLQGEPGTGKEEVARAVHARSPRSGSPFVVLDAATVAAPLADSELVGHEPGAIAGAEGSYQGAFERANGGTLFIDDVGELPLSVQPRLLRVLERREIVRIGGSDAISVDVRVIASTPRDLRLEIDAGRFREDLYSCLAQVRVVLPALRARLGDVPALARHFLDRMVEPGAAPVAIDDAALTELIRRPFPGNVRELRDVLVRAAALCEGACIRVGDIAGEGYGFRGSEAERSALDLAGTFSDAKQRAIERFERAYLETLMRRTGRNLSRAAREADLARHHLRDLLRKRGLYRDGDGGTGGPP
jgi:DNA-binding NtrC family response regulator